MASDDLRRAPQYCSEILTKCPIVATWQINSVLSLPVSLTVWAVSRSTATARPITCASTPTAARVRVHGGDHGLARRSRPFRVAALPRGPTLFFEISASFVFLWPAATAGRQRLFLLGPLAAAGAPAWRAHARWMRRRRRPWYMACGGYVDGGLGRQTGESLAWRTWRGGEAAWASCLVSR